MESQTSISSGDDNPIEGLSAGNDGSYYVVSYTNRAGMPTSPGAFQEDLNCVYEPLCHDIFVAKYAITGSYQTYIGGSDDDWAGAISVDSSGEAYISGVTSSPDFPGTNGGLLGEPDAFVLKLNSTGTSLEFNTLIGQESDIEEAHDVIVNSYNEVFALIHTTYDISECIASMYVVCPRSLSLSKVDGNSGSIVSSFVLWNYEEYIGRGSIASDIEGNLYITIGNHFAKVDANGGIISSTTFNLGENDQVEDITVGKDGFSYIVWNISNGIPGDHDTIVAKVGQNGEITNQTTINNCAGWAIDINIYGELFVSARKQDATGYILNTILQLNSTTLALEDTKYFDFIHTNYHDTAKAIDFDRYGTGYVGFNTGQDYLVFTIEQNGSIVRDATTNSKCCDPAGSPNMTQGYSADPINTRTGGFDYSIVDLSIPTPAGPLTFQRFYSSLTTSQFVLPLGYGWSNNQDIRLIFPGQPGGDPDAVIFQSTNQNQYRFIDNGDGTYSPEPGLISKLTRIAGSPINFTVTDSSQRIYTFNDLGKAISWSDEKGNLWNYLYDTNGRLERIADESGAHFLEIGYTDGYLTSVTDYTGRSVHYNYTNGDLTSFVDPIDHLWTYAYDTTNLHHLRSIIDPGGKTIVQNEYDAQGRAYQQFNGGGIKIVDITYGTDGTTTISDGNGNGRTHLYSQRNTLISNEGSNHGAATQKFDVQFRPSLVGDGQGHSTLMQWSADGANLEKIVDPTGGSTDLFYDAQNNITLLTDPRNFSTIYEYDGTLLTGVRDPLTPENEYTSVYTYTTATDAPQPSGLLKTSQDAFGNVTTYTYNEMGLVTSITDSQNKETEFGYDALGRRITSKSPSGRTDWTCYDAASRVIRNVTNASGDGLTPATNPCDAANYVPSVDLNYDRIQTTVYDLSDNVIATTDSDGIITRTYYDSNNRPVTVVRNLIGQAIELTTPPTYNTAFPDQNLRNDTVYDNNGNAIATIDTLGIITRTYHDPENRPQYVVRNLYNQSIEMETPPAYDPSFPDRNVRTETVYDLAGNVIASIDSNGVITRTYYDAANRPVTVVRNLYGVAIADPLPPTYSSTYPDRNVRTDTVYDLAGNAIASIDPNGNITRTYFDGINRPQTVVQNLSGQAVEVGTPPSYDPAYPHQNLITDYVYDSIGNQIAVVDPAGVITRTYFDSQNRPTIVVHNLQGQTIEQTTPPVYNPDYPDQNVRTENRYNDQGRSIATIDPNGVIARTYYDAYDRVSFVVANLTGQTIETDIPPSYDPQYPDQNLRTEYRYDWQGRQIARVDNAGKITRSYFDVLGRTYLVVQNLTSKAIDDPVPPIYDPQFPDQNIRSETLYDGAGRAYQMMDALGRRSYSCFDGQSRVVKSIVNPTVSNPCEDYTSSSATDEDIITTTTYDAAGNRLVTRDPNGKEVTFQYDPLGRVLVETDPLQHTTQYSYDAIGNQIMRKDAADVVTAYEYDPLNHLKAVVENYRPGVAANQEINVRTEYTYDVSGNRKTIKDGLNHTTTFTYDALGRLLSESDALNHTTFYQYNAAGNRVSLQDANGATTIYHYDGLGRVTNIDYPDPDTDISFSYDAAGNRANLTDGTGTTHWDYDALNRPKAITDPTNAVVRYGYNAAGQRTLLQYPDNKTVGYVYDNAGRLEVVTGWDTLNTQYTYDRAGRPNTVTLPNGVISTYTFDDASRLTSLAHQKDAQVLSSFTYGYDAVGNRTSVTEVLEPPAELNTDPLFQNDFEDGDLSAWSGSQTDGGDLSASAEAKAGGSYGMQAVLDDNNSLYTVDWTPVAEKHYRARFYFDANTVTMAAADVLQLFQAYDQNDTLVGVVELRTLLGDYQLRLGARNDSTGWTYSSWIAITDRMHAVELEWRAATSVGTNNGGMTLWIDGVQRNTFATLDNDTRQVDYIELGAMGVDAGTRGTLFYDAFASRLESYIDLDPAIVLEPDPLKPDLVYRDGFDTGDFSLWSETVTDNGDLSITTLAALSGTNGMQAVINNNTALYVTDWSPSDETHYRARFHFDPNSIAMANGDDFRLFEFYNRDNVSIGYIGLRYSVGDYQIQGYITKDSGSVTTPWVTITDGPNEIEFDWQAASLAGANNGTYTLWVNDVQQAALSGIDNDTRTVDYARLGAVAGINTDTRGTLYLDSFESRRESFIGADPLALPPVPFPAKPNALFADPFETGSLADWSAAVTGGGDLSLTTQAALSGTNGLQAVINDDTEIYVTDWRPFEETRYQARFHFDPNGIVMAHGNAFQMMDVYNRAGTAVACLNFRFVAGDYQIQGAIAKDSGSLYTPWITVSDGPHAVELAWQAASAAGANDGSFTLWLDGAQAAAISAVDNDTHRVEYASLGAVVSIDTGTRGTLYFDSFESRRATYIGPDPNALPAVPFPAKPDALFTDTFESGTLNAWSTTVTDSGDLSVTTQAALSGMNGLQAVIDDNTEIYVTSWAPFEETHYRARFHFDPNSIGMAHDDELRILDLYNHDDISMGYVNFRFSAGDYQIQAVAAKDSSTVATPWFSISDGPHAIELDWRAATAAGANNGGLNLWIDGIQVSTLSGIDNDTRRVDYDRLGAAYGIQAGTRGTLYFDSFESHRETSVGPDPNALPAMPFPEKLDALFGDPFESGDLNAWSAATIDSGDLSVTTQAALSGTNGLQAVIDDNTAIYVTDWKPFAETHYRARFHFDPNAITMADGNTFYLLQAFSRDVSTPAVNIRLRSSSGDYQVQAGILNDGSTVTYTPWLTISDGPHAFEIEWQASSGSNNGLLNFWADGAAAGSVTGIDNDTRRIEYTNFGPSSIPNGSRGTIFFDSFESRRNTQIGVDPNALLPVPLDRPDTLFLDGFESADMSAWTSAVTDSGDLSVSAAAALNGANGLQAVIDDNVSIYMTDWRPFDENHYRARFLFDPNSITMASGNAHYLLYALNRDNVVVARMEFRYYNGAYQVRADAVNDGSTFTNSTWTTISDGPHTLELEWQASSAAGANSGKLVFWVDDVQCTSVTTVDNDTRRVDAVRLGAVYGVDTGTRGTEYFDAFESRRESYIGLMAGLQGGARKVLALLVAADGKQPPVDKPSETDPQPVLLKLPGQANPAGLPVLPLSMQGQSSSQTITYTYDPLYRLRTAAYSDGTSFVYTYDAVGNRLTKTRTGGLVDTYTYDIANRLTTVNGVNNTWDNNGNLLSDGINSYTYNHANRLVDMSRVGLIANYSYNGLGDRVSETINGVTTNFTLDLNAGLTQILADGTNMYLYGNDRIAQYEAGISDYFLGDALGSVRQLVNETGVVMLAKSYQPYGEGLSSLGSGSSNYGFTNEYTSSDIKLINLRSRLYSPEMGRFLTRDSWQGDYIMPMSYNAWLYGFSNPVKNKDPLGLCPNCVIFYFTGAGNTGQHGSESYRNEFSGFEKDLLNILDNDSIVIELFPYGKGRTSNGNMGSNIFEIWKAAEQLSSVPKNKAREIWLYLVGMDAFLKGKFIKNHCEIDNYEIDNNLLKINFLTFSGGGQMAYSTIQEMTGRAFADNLVMIGSPFKAYNGSSNTGHLWDVVGTAEDIYWGAENYTQWHHYNEGYWNDWYCYPINGEVTCTGDPEEDYDPKQDLYANSNVTKCDLIGEGHGIDENGTFGGIKCYGGGQNFEEPASSEDAVTAFADFLKIHVGIGR